MISKLKNLIKDSIEMEKKSTRSQRLYNIIAIALLFADFVLLSICWTLFLSGSAVAVKFWLWAFYFIVALYWGGFVIGVKQRLRGGYLLSRIASITMTICLAMGIALLIYLRVELGGTPIFPFRY